MRNAIIILILGLVFQGCGPSKKSVVIFTDQPAPWTLTVTPHNRHDEIAAIVSRLTSAFHKDHVPVTRSIAYKASPGWRWCGNIYTVGCNPTPHTVEMDVDWAAYVVGHEFFHVFSYELGNFHAGRDPHHLDPRWPEWEAWRDKQL